MLTNHLNKPFLLDQELNGFKGKRKRGREESSKKAVTARTIMTMPNLLMSKHLDPSAPTRPSTSSADVEPMDLDENNTAVEQYHINLGDKAALIQTLPERGSGNKNDSERGLLNTGRRGELRGLLSTIDALLGTPLAKKRQVEWDDVFVKFLHQDWQREDDDLNDDDFETVDMFVEVLGQQLNSMFPYLPHNPRRLNDKVI
ncbi:hypothetical protein BJ742DRAFT_772317 [Cladochytrium replicatum]|nr:hypothetical protein BJ742DRAFT_772317 [Cladochytrium replicatum]